MIVALSNGQVRLYNDRILVNVIHFEGAISLNVLIEFRFYFFSFGYLESDPVVAVHFGNFNTYDGVFIAVTRAGLNYLVVKVM